MRLGFIIDRYRFNPLSTGVAIIHHMSFLELTSVNKISYNPIK